MVWSPKLIAIAIFNKNCPIANLLKNIPNHITEIKIVA